MQLVLLAARTAEDFEGAFATMVRERAGSFLVVPSPLFTAYRAALAQLALTLRRGIRASRADMAANGLTTDAPCGQSRQSAGLCWATNGSPGWA